MERGKRGTARTSGRAEERGAEGLHLSPPVDLAAVQLPLQVVEQVGIGCSSIAVAS